MSREAWRVIRQSKRFYVRTYRLMSSMLLFSSILNVVLGGCIYVIYFNQPPRKHYATNGATHPIELTAMSKRNNSPDPLLANDPVEDEMTRVLPE